LREYVLVLLFENEHMLVARKLKGQKPRNMEASRFMGLIPSVYSDPKMQTTTDSKSTLVKMKSKISTPHHFGYMIKK